MISVWRIESEKHLDAMKTGKGALLYGGRWNEKGTPLIYASDSLALATLEKFVHLSRFDFKMKLRSLEIKIPKSVLIKKLNTAQFEDIITTTSTQIYGSQWAEDKKTAILKVPSAIIKSEFNYLINPEHPDFMRIKFCEPVDFSFDDRLWK